MNIFGQTTRCTYPGTESILAAMHLTRLFDTM